MEWLKQYFSAIPVLTQRGLNHLKQSPQWHQLPQELQLFLEIAVISQPEGLTAEQFNRWANANQHTTTQTPLDIQKASSQSTTEELSPNETIRTYVNEQSK